MENINTIAIKVLKSYKEFSQSGDINELKIWSSFYMREFIRSTEKDEDLASEVYLKLEGKMDHLIRKFYAKSPNKYLSFLKVCAKNIVRNLTKKSIKENQVMDYLVYTHGIENSCHVVDQSRFMKQLMKNVEEAAFPWNCIFVLKHDLPMIKKVEEELRNYFFKRGEFFGNFMAYHHSKQEKFSRKRSKLLDELNYLTFKLVNFPKDTKVSHWKQKKELKLKRLEYILNHGLYSGSELADIFQIEHFKLRRKLSNMKFQWGKLPYPNGEFPQSEAA